MLLKALFGASAVTLPLLIAATCWLACPPRQATQAANAEICDIACSLSPSELPERRARWAAFRASARDITELKDGYAMRFDLDDPKLLEAARLAAAESHCCGFLDFRIVVQPGKRLLTVEMTGPDGAKKFLAENIFTASIGTGAAPSCDCPTPEAVAVDTQHGDAGSIVVEAAR